MSRRDHHNRVSIHEGCIVTIERAAKSCTGSLMDISAQGAGVFFGEDMAGGLPVGESVALSISGESLEKVVPLNAQVMYRVDSDDGSRYGFAFLDTSALSASQMAVFRQLVNRREAFRVAPKAGLRLYVELGVRLHGEQEGSLLRRAQVVNLSATGMALMVSEKSEAIFSAKRTLPISICLAPDRQSFSISGTIQNRCLTSQGVRYGIAFDVRDSGYLSHQEELLSYIMERQRAHVQKK